MKGRPSYRIRVGNYRIIYDIYDSPSLDKEALRLIRNMPRWHPAIRDGMPVDIEWVQKIKFTR